MQANIKLSKKCYALNLNEMKIIMIITHHSYVSTRASKKHYASSLRDNASKKCYASSLRSNASKKCYTSSLRGNTSKKCYTLSLSEHKNKQKVLYIILK